MQSEFVFMGDQRWASCHASTICELENGDLVVAWYAGSRGEAPEGASDSVILGSRMSVGQGWSPYRVWVNVVNRAVGNPKLFVGPDKNLWLIAPVNYGNWCKGGTRLFVKRSCDGGDNWTDLEILCDTPGILGKNKPLRLKSGVWLIPVENECSCQPAFLRSEDSGISWDLVMVPTEDTKVIQPSIVQLSDGSLLAYARSWEGFIYEMRSADEGKTWSVPKPLSIPNNNSGIDMVGLNSGNLVLVFNRSGLGRRYRADGQRAWGPRNPLNVVMSIDEGKRWLYELELEPLADGETYAYPDNLAEIRIPSKGEYSYPSVIQGSDESIHIVYTYQRIAIKHVVLSEEELSAVNIKEHSQLK